MTPIVLTPQGLPVKDRGGGIVTTPLVTAGRGSRAMLTGITRIAPGAAVPLHTHNCEECVVVLSGNGVAHIDGTDHPGAASVGNLSAAFVGPAGVGAMSSPTFATLRDDAYASVATLNDLAGSTYYNESWTVLSLIMMTGLMDDLTLP